MQPHGLHHAKAQSAHDVKQQASHEAARRTLIKNLLHREHQSVDTHYTVNHQYLLQSASMFSVAKFLAYSRGRTGSKRVDSSDSVTLAGGDKDVVKVTDPLPGLSG